VASDLEELRQQFTDDEAEWEPIRQEGAKDMRYVAGDPWDPKERAAREDAGRVCLSLDELSQYTNQGINRLRANKRAVQFTPTGNGANDETAEFYGDKMREIEYRSSAQIAYITAAENAFQRSFGFTRVSTRYEHPTSINQDIWIDPIHNPDLVTPDPYALMPDMSDMRGCWIREPWTHEDFNRRFPRAKLEGRALSGAMVDAPAWVSDKLIWVSERWKVRTTRRKLLIVQPAPQMQAQPGAVLGLSQQQPDIEPVGIFEDEYKRDPIPGTVLEQHSRMVDDPHVYHCLTNGIDILEETPWKGKHIPIVSCLGKVLWVDGKRQILSLIRLARDPYMLYCYYRTCEAELVGMTPKFPYFYYEGQLDHAGLVDIQKSLHEPVAAIKVKASIDGLPAATILPHPTRQPYEPPIQALEVGAEAARRAIQAAVGQTPLPTQAQRRNEKSGVALKHIEEAIEVGSYHFTDHYLDMIRRVGVIVEDLIPHIYDSARKVGIRKPNDTAEIVSINVDGGISTKGDHLVTVSTGPSFESTREAASDFADTLAGIGPEIFLALGPLIVRLKELGPIGDEMAEVLEALQPPLVQALRARKEQQNGQQDAVTELMATKAQLEKVMAAASEMQKVIETEQHKQQATIEKAKIDADTQIKLQHIKNAATIRVAEINAEVKGLEIGHEAEHEALALGVEVAEAEKDRQHERDVTVAQADIERLRAEQDHGQAMEAGEREHRRTVELTDRQHRQALEAGDQQVAGKLAVEASKPKPSSGNGAKA
jgi:hypothetical protein